MGRSIDMANLPSNKNVQTIKKKPTASSQLNRSIYNWFKNTLRTYKLTIQKYIIFNLTHKVSALLYL